VLAVCEADGCRLGCSAVYTVHHHQGDVTVASTSETSVTYQTSCVCVCVCIKFMDIQR
jgi:hypothetical protein